MKKEDIANAFIESPPRELLGAEPTRGIIDVVYEHDSWFVCHIPTGAYWSVIECETMNGEDYIDFELLDKGDLEDFLYDQIFSQEEE